MWLVLVHDCRLVPRPWTALLKHHLTSLFDIKTSYKHSVAGYNTKTSVDIWTTVRSLISIKERATFCGHVILVVAVVNITYLFHRRIHLACTYDSVCQITCILWDLRFSRRWGWWCCFSGFWRRVESPVDANVSEKHTVDIFRAEDGALEKHTVSVFRAASSVLKMDTVCFPFFMCRSFALACLLIWSVCQVLKSHFHLCQ
jgi:hypothetical protein